MLNAVQSIVNGQRRGENASASRRKKHLFSQTNVESEWPHSKVDNVPKVLEWIFRGKDTRIHPFLNNGP